MTPRKITNSSDYKYCGEVIERYFVNNWGSAPMGWVWRGQRFDTLKDAAKAIDQSKLAA